MSTSKLSYTDKQMIHSLRANGVTILEIEEALGIPKSTVHRVIHEDIEQPVIPDIVGDGCYSVNTHSGELSELNPTDQDSGLSYSTPGQLTKLESGYPDIYYNEQSKRWEIWLHGKRVWRATNLVTACEVRLRKGSLTPSEANLLQSVLDAPPEVQEAINYPPV